MRHMPLINRASHSFLVLGLALAGIAAAGLPAAHGQEVKSEKIVLSPGLNVWSVAVSADGKRAAASVGDMTIRILDLESGKTLSKWEAHKHPAIHGVAFSPDGKLVFSCCEFDSARAWDVATGKQVREFGGQQTWAYAFDVSRDGKKLLTASTDATLRLFDIETGKLLVSMKIDNGRVDAPFRSVAFGTKDEFAVAGNAKG